MKSMTITFERFMNVSPAWLNSTYGARLAKKTRSSDRDEYAWNDSAVLFQYGGMKKRKISSDEFEKTDQLSFKDTFNPHSTSQSTNPSSFPGEASGLSLLLEAMLRHEEDSN